MNSNNDAGVRLFTATPVAANFANGNGPPLAWDWVAGALYGLKNDNTVVMINGSAGVAWGSITGTLSSQTDLQAALDGKQPTGTYATGGGTATGTNTGDNAVNTLYSSLAASKQDTLVSATNIKTINGASVLGSGDLTVSSSYNTVATLASNQATGANVTPVTLTGLVWTFAANSVYFFRWLGTVQPAAATTGCGFQLDVSAAVTQISMSFYHQLATASTITGGNSIADDASQSVTSGMPGTGAYPINGMGMLRTGANTGTAQLRFRSEVAAVTTALAGMTLVVEKVA